ncbi:hypothetical protein G5B30_14270 [Sphingobacterium sp. SGG-5]|nr:hypothetical protein [Sphingobacterium sp. SGG-5]
MGRGWQEGRSAVANQCSDKAWALGRYQVPARPARGQPCPARGQKTKIQKKKEL